MGKISWLKRPPSSKKNDNGPIVGIDISSQFATILEIHQRKQTYILKRCSHIQLAEPAFKNDTLVSNEALQQALNTLKQQTHIKHARSIIATPASSIMSKTMPLDPALTDSQQEAAAIREAKKTFTALGNDLMVDYAPLKSSDNEALLVGGRKTQIQQRIEGFTQADLPPIVVDIDYLALQRAADLFTQTLPDSWQQKPFAMAHINSSYILFIVIHEGQIAYHHHQHYEGRKLSNIITTLFNKTSTPIDDQENEQALQQAAQQVQRQWQYYQAHQPKQTLAGLILSGTLACIEQADQFFSQTIGNETIIADPISHMTIEATIDSEQLSLISPSIMLACGLAMRKPS